MNELPAGSLPPNPPADVSAPDAQPAGDQGGALELRRLQEVIEQKLRPSPFGPHPAGPAAPPAAVAAGHLQELAEDMVDLLRRAKGIEAAQAETVSRLDRLEQAVREGLLQQARETDRLRRDLLDEHKALAARAAFEAVLPAL